MPVAKFDNTHAPVARYDFDGDLLDASGNGLHLTGTNAAFRKVWSDGTLGLCSGTAARTAADALLSVAGDVTVELLLVLRSAPSAAELVRFAAAGEAQSANYQYSLALTSQDQVRWLTEHGAGVNDDFVCPPSGFNVPSLPALHVPFFLAATRANNVVQMYLDGVPWGSPATLTAPDGGSASKLELKASGSGFPDLLALKIVAAALTPAQIVAEYNRTLGQEFPTLDAEVLSLWVGALTAQGVTVVAQLSYASDAVRLAVEGPEGTAYSSEVATSDRVAKMTISGLDPDTEYSYSIETDGQAIEGPVGRFRTAPSGNASFTIAFGGDASSGSSHEVFESIRDAEPLSFLNLGDAFYADIATNSPALYTAAYDELCASPAQSVLYREIPTVYVWDDHDYATNNSSASAAGRPAACQTYRARVPHYPLGDTAPTGPIYQTFDIGRVRFLVTDQRSAASADTAADNSSKSMLGAAQKAWFKDLLENSEGMLLVWICPRTFGGVATANADHWGGFTTEREELAAHIHSHCPGRVIVLSADAHALGIDDGSHHDFLSGGGEPLPTFQAAPLDRTPDGSPYGGVTYSEGWFNGNGQWGTMSVDDAGGSSLLITWRGLDSAANVLATHSFYVSV